MFDFFLSFLWSDLNGCIIVEWGNFLSFTQWVKLTND